MKKTLLVTFLSFALAFPALSAEKAKGVVEDMDFSFEGMFGTYDKDQLRRGLQVFTEVCAGCHGLNKVAYRNLGDKGGPELSQKQIKEYMSNFEIFDIELDDYRAATPSDKFENSSIENAPDLSLMAKARAGFHGPYGLGINQLIKGMGGPEYIVNLLLKYNEEEKEQAGSILYGNDIYPGGWIAMGQPLWGEDVEYEDGTEATIEQEAKDVAAFLMWAAEPKLNNRKEAGFLALSMMIVLAGLLFLTNRRLWAPIKGKQ